MSERPEWITRAWAIDPHKPASTNLPLRPQASRRNVNRSRGLSKKEIKEIVGRLKGLSTIRERCYEGLYVLRLTGTNISKILEAHFDIKMTRAAVVCAANRERKDREEQAQKQRVAS